MAVSCAKGHVNDDANRFCDQCGLPLQAAPAAAPQEVTFVSMPAAGASSVVCPVCGQENVPGTAFCDNCGAVLPPPQPSLEQPAGAAEVPVAQAKPGAVTAACPSCGTTNDAANRFCESCGASLVPAEANTAQTAQPMPAEGMTVVQGEVAPPVSTAQVQPLDSAPPVAAQGDSAPPPDVAGAGATQVEVAVDAVPQPDAPIDSMPSDPALPEAPAEEEAPAEQQAPVAELPAMPAADTAAERAQLEGEIETQQRLVTQLEGMQQSFGAATPPSILQGLDEARAALAAAEQELQQLAPAAPPVDPAEVARLEGEIETQQRLVTQLEGMQQSFGAATPPSILQGLDEARAALAAAEQELAALAGGSATPAASAPSAGENGAAEMPAPVAEVEQPAAEFAPPAVESAPPAETAVPAVEVAAAVPEMQAAEAAPPPSAPAQASASGPRFVDRDGKVLSLPSSSGELVIGREDPVSGIHPEVDLTPHGGEAGGVSRRHAVMQQQAGQWTITDLDSTNYTRVDGSRIPSNTPTPLRDGARVQFGRVEFEFRAN